MTNTTKTRRTAFSTVSNYLGFAAIGAALLLGACDEGDYEPEDEMGYGEEGDEDEGEEEVLMAVDPDVELQAVEFTPELEEAAVDFDAIEEGDGFADDCNLCVLTKTGATCTLQACVDPEDEANRDKAPASCNDGEYQEGEMWMESCNMCTCTADGAACTIKECDPDALPY